MPPLTGSIPVDQNQVPTQAAINTSTGAVAPLYAIPQGDGSFALEIQQVGVLTTQLQPTTSGGLTPYRSLDVQPAGASVKASPGQLYGYYLSNNGSAVRYLKIYDKATAPLSTDVPVMTLMLPAGAAANVSHPNGIAFANGIGIRATTGVGDTDTGAPTANDVIANLYYK